jgi:F0F1-type ATP synthase assembly protein I
MNRPSHAAAAPRGRAPSGGELAGLGVFLAAVVVVPLVIGAVIDNVTHTAPFLLFAGLAIGIVAGGAVVYTRFKQYL